MPTYQYRCKSCEEDLEIFHSVMDKPKKKCPKCGKKQLVRIITSPPAVIFKGQGWTPKYHD